MATTARQELTKLHGYHSKTRTDQAAWLPQQDKNQPSCMATTTMVTLWREAKKLTEFERTSDGTAVFNHASIRTVSETDTECV